MSIDKKLSSKYGRRAEECAIVFLQKKGWLLLQKNYKIRNGEIDIILLDGDEMVFVEVKWRKKGSLIPAIESISFAQRKRIIHTALFFITTIEWAGPFRFDVIAMDEGEEIKHIEDAFS